MRLLPRHSATLLALAALGAVHAATLTVDVDGTADFVTIQSAIDAALPGQDEVFVRCGSYFENLVLRDGVSVRGAGARCTTIEPFADDRPVVTMTALGADTVLRGFTVHNRVSHSLNSSGIAVWQGAPVITRNVIVGEGRQGYSGPGMIIEGGAEPLIAHNVIRGNYSCCVGGGVLIYGSSPIVRANLIVANVSYYGAGVASESGQPQFEHNTIVENEGWVGGGLWLSGAEPLTLRGNIVAFNTAQIYGGGVLEVSPAVAENNDVFGNAPDDYAFFDRTGSQGNVSVDPEFVDRRADGFAGFGLRSSSPLIDRGGPAAPDELDLRGVPRNIDGDVDGAAFRDLGARENEGISGLVVGRTHVSWDPGVHVPPRYDLFRGDLALLRSGGAYIQDPATVVVARHACGVGSETADFAIPDAGEAFFFLVAAVGNAPGTLGFDSALNARERTLDCIAD